MRKERAVRGEVREGRSLWWTLLTFWRTLLTFWRILLNLPSNRETVRDNATRQVGIALAPTGCRLPFVSWTPTV